MKGLSEVVRGHMNGFPKAAANSIKNPWQIVYCSNFRKPVKPFHDGLRDPLQPIGFELENTSGFRENCHY
jgi:hypothetical protein